LLCHVLHIRPEIIYSNFDYVISDSEYRRLTSLINRAIKHEPISYITKEKEFYGINLFVNNDVLIPRPETELLVEEAIIIIREKLASGEMESLTVADIGTGSGAISIGIASNVDKVKIYALDISRKALEVVRTNISMHSLTGSIIPIYSNLLQSLPETVDLIVANLPYIKQSDFDTLPPEIKKYEPAIALNGGKIGLEKILELLRTVKNHLKNNGYVLIEMGQGQSDYLINFLADYYHNVRFSIIHDFNGIARILKIWFE
jgi:release factor glutamine methyltransferase